MSNFTVDVHGLNNFSDEQKGIFLQEVVPLLEKVCNSEEFKRRVLAYSYGYYITTGRWWNRKRTYHKEPGFKLSNAKTNKEIYDMFISGVDKHNSASDKDLDLFLTIYSSRKSVIGYTYPSTFKTWVNSKFFGYWLKSRSGQCNIIGNIVHEYMHNVGFGHAYRGNSTRQHTVPYAFGYLARDVAELFI